MDVDIARAANILPMNVQVVTSLSCPHCRDHADDIFKILQPYLDSGEIVVQHVDYPVDLATLVATKLSWMHGQENHYGLYRKLLNRQEEWHDATGDWRQKLKNIAREMGFTDEEIRGAFNEEYSEKAEKIEKRILDRMNHIVKKHNLQFVPMLILNDKLVVEIDAKAFKKALRELQKSPPKSS